MRILHIDTEMTWRGGENQLRLLLEGLNATDAESHAALCPESAAADRLRSLAPLALVPMRGGFNPRAAWHLSRYCQKHGIQIIDAHTSNAHALGLMLKAILPNLKLVVHRRVDYPPGASWLNRRKYLSPHIDRYVAISTFISEVLTAYGVPRARISVVRSAVPMAPYQKIDKVQARAALAQRFNVDPTKCFIGNASAFTEQKGIDVLLDAAAVLKRRGLPFHLYLAGTGVLAGAMQRRCASLALTAQVSFLGFIDQVPEFLSALDVLAVPSNYEGLGTVILDGLAAGLAVAATAVGGIPEIIIAGETGLLSPRGDVSSLADNLEALIRSPDLRRQLHATGRQHIEREFSVAAMVGGNLDIYREVLGREG